MRRRHFPLLPALAIVASLSLAACTGGGPEPTESPDVPTTGDGRPLPSESLGPVDVPDPRLRPDLSAEENLAFFDWVNLAVIAADPNAGGQAFTDALAAGGFDVAAMQRTDDRTTLGSPADSIQFSVLFQGECLIGQYGPGSGGYHSAVRPQLGTGGCLISSTVPVD